MSLIKAEIEDQNREREALKDLLASRISTLNSLMDTHVEEVLKQSAPAAIEAVLESRIDSLTAAAAATRMRFLSSNFNLALCLDAF